MKKARIFTNKVILSLLIGLLGLVYSAFSLDFSASGKISVKDLPQEAQLTLVLIKQGGPYPFSQDDKTFGNYEGLLPKKERGYYREYTVKHPKARSRGKKRIVAGGWSPNQREFYYTSDHYNSFRKIIE